MTSKAHRILGYLCFLAAVGAAMLATKAASEHFVSAYWTNAIVFLICSGLALFNLSRARKLDHE